MRSLKDLNIARNVLRSPLITKSGIASLDQAMLSALNFLVSIILIKNVSKAEFGYYSIAFSISLFLISLQNAIVNTPLAVLLVTKKGAHRQLYVASLCYGQFVAILPAACMGLGSIAVLSLWGLDSIQASVAAALCVAAVGLLFREFLRAFFFAEETPLQVLKIDTAYVALFLCLIALTYLFRKISVASIFVLMGLSALLCALFFSRKRGWHYRQKSIRESYRENWKLGKWALLGVCVTHIQNYSYLYLLGALLGSVAVADVSAARLLLMPLVFVEVGWSKIAVPHGSKLREEGQTDRIFKQQGLANLVLLLGIVAYVAFLFAISGTLQRFLFTERYATAYNYLLFWGAIFAMRFTALNASCGLQVMKDFQTISKVNLVTMLVTLGCAYFFIRSHGIEGGLTALIIGGGMLAASLWFYFAKTVFFKLGDQRTTDSGKKILVHSLKRYSVTISED